MTSCHWYFFFLQVLRVFVVLSGDKHIQLTKARLAPFIKFLGHIRDLFAEGTRNKQVLKMIRFVFSQALRLTLPARCRIPYVFPERSKWSECEAG